MSYNDDLAKAITRLSAYGRDFDLKAFLSSNLDLDPWSKEDKDKISAEVLYYDEEQGLLQQLETVGFDTARHKRYRAVMVGDARGMGLCSYAVVHGTPVLVPNVAFDIRYQPVQEPDDTVSELVVPLTLGQKVIGVLNLESVREGVFRHRHQEYFMAIAPLLAIMIAYHASREDEEFFNKAVHSLSPAFSEDALYDVFLDRVRELIEKKDCKDPARKLGEKDCKGCVIVASDKGRPQVRVVANRGISLEGNAYSHLSDLSAIKRALDGQAVDSMVQLGVSERPEALSSYITAVNKIGGRYVVLLIEAPHEKVTARARRSVRRLANYVTDLVRSGKQIEEQQRELAMKEVLGLVQNEAHNEAGILSLLLSQILQSVAVPKNLVERCRKVEDNIRELANIVSGFQVSPERVSLLDVKQRALSFSTRIGVECQAEGDFEVLVNCSRDGLRWIIDNLILNSAHHARTRGTVNVHLENKADGDHGVLRYWDDGRIDDPAAAEERLEGREGATGRRGMKIIELLARQFEWVFKHRIENNTLVFYFSYSVAHG